MAILEANSGADINASLMRLQLYAFLDVEIYPLMTAEEALAQAKQALKAVKKQK